MAQPKCGKQIPAQSYISVVLKGLDIFSEAMLQNCLHMRRMI